jgi:DNA polymerase-3 subunit epsilon
VLTTMLTDASVPLIVFNARYDLTVIDREARRLGLVAELAKIRSFVVDPLVIDYHLDRYRPKTVASHKLVDVCRLYGATLDRAHDAASDAISAARLAWAITEKGHVVRRCRGDQERREALELRAEWDSVRYDLPLLHHAQKRWATERALNFAEYLETELGDAEALDRADAIRQIEARFWPVIPPAERRLAA